MTEQLKNNILSLINRISDDFVKKSGSSKILKGIFITGSFVSYLRNSKEKKSIHLPEKFLPDVNFYILIDGNDEYVTEYTGLLNNTVRSAVLYFKKKGIKFNIFFDLHPFSITKEKKIIAGDYNNFQLTTRVIDKSNIYRYALHSWFGWRSNHIVIYPANAEIFDKLNLPAKVIRNEKWFRTLYLGLVSYGNVLQILPLYSNNKEFIAAETYKYLKELLLDGIHMAVSDIELAQRDYYDIIYGWKKYARTFYEKKYGKEAANIVTLVIHYSKYGNTGKLKIDKEPIEFIKLFFKLRNIIFEKGLKVKIREQKKELNFKLIFEELPLWW